MTKLRKPIGLCPTCDLAEIDVGLAGGVHMNPSTKKRCGGAFRSTVNVGDWAECYSCGASGVADSGTCITCNGIGSLFARPGGFDGRMPPGGKMPCRRR
jgi:hypothetical protein